MNDCLVIVPTRGRQKRIEYFYDHFIKNSVNSDLILVCDQDDQPYPKLSKARYSYNERMTVPEKINIIAEQEMSNYKYLSFLGDDHIPKTFGWDQILMDTIPNFGIAYGNDLWQGKRLPTVCIMTSNIPEALGYMAIPVVKHFFIDNAWAQWGLGVNSLHYSDSTIIEHLHPDAKKGDMDDTYRITGDYINSDMAAYEKYLMGRLSIDIMKLRGAADLLNA